MFGEKIFSSVKMALGCWMSPYISALSKREPQSDRPDPTDEAIQHGFGVACDCIGVVRPPEVHNKTFIEKGLDLLVAHCNKMSEMDREYERAHVNDYDRFDSSGLVNLAIAGVQVAAFFGTVYLTKKVVTRLYNAVKVLVVHRSVPVVEVSEIHLPNINESENTTLENLSQVTSLARTQILRNFSEDANISIINSSRALTTLQGRVGNRMAQDDNHEDFRIGIRLGATFDAPMNTEARNMITRIGNTYHALDEGLNRSMSNFVVDSSRTKIKSREVSVFEKFTVKTREDPVAAYLSTVESKFTLIGELVRRIRSPRYLIPLIKSTLYMIKARDVVEEVIRVDEDEMSTEGYIHIPTCEDVIKNIMPVMKQLVTKELDGFNNVCSRQGWFQYIIGNDKNISQQTLEIMASWMIYDKALEALRTNSDYYICGGQTTITASYIALRVMNGIFPKYSTRVRVWPHQRVHTSMVQKCLDNQHFLWNAYFHLGRGAHLYNQKETGSFAL